MSAANGSFAGGWSLDITVNATAAPTTTTISSNNNPSFTSPPNNSVTFKANVASTGTVNEGTVSFTANGSPIAGCTNVAVSSGQAQCTTSFATEGDRTVTATSGIPTGTVEFFDGATSLGTGTLSPTTGSSAQATLTTNALSAGSHNITAVYAGASGPGGGGFNGSTSSILTQVVNAPMLSINDVTQVEGNSGTTNFTFTVSLSQAIPQTGRSITRLPTVRQLPEAIIRRPAEL